MDRNPSTITDYVVRDSNSSLSGGERSAANGKSGDSAVTEVGVRFADDGPVHSGAVGRVLRPENYVGQDSKLLVLGVDAGRNDDSVAIGGCISSLLDAAESFLP